MKKQSRLKIAGRLSLLAALALATGVNLAHANGEKPLLRLVDHSKIKPEWRDLPGISSLKDCGKMLDASFRLSSDEKNEAIEKMIKELQSEIIGQDHAIEDLAKALEMAFEFLADPEKPIGRFMFLGPTGVGKTELVRALVRFLGGNPDVQLIRFDGGELQLEHEISRIKGAPPGFKGVDLKPALHPDNVVAARLTYTLRDGKKISLTILLFDEIEKMNESVYKLLLGILDNGHMTLGDNTPSPLRKTLIFGTSNEGAKDVEKLVNERRAQIKERKARGEILSEIESDDTGHIDLEFGKKMQETYEAAIARKFSPEFRNRWQKFITFKYLRKKEFLKISEVMLSKVQKRIFERARDKFAFQLTPQAREWLVNKGTDFKNGSRELMNVIEFQLTYRLSKLLSTNQVKTGDVVLVDVDPTKDALTFDRIAAGLSEEQLKAHADKVYPGKKMLNVKFATAADDSVEEKSAVVAGILKELSESRIVMSHLWGDATKSPVKRETVTLAGGATDSIGYKYISVEGVMIRLSISSREVEEIRAKEPNATAFPVKAQILKEGIPEGDKLQYVAPATLHETTIRQLDWLREQTRKGPPATPAQ